jgi:hypothetical protein
MATPTKLPDLTGLQPLTITSTNCRQMAGVSWEWLTTFARGHGVPIWRVGGRRLIHVPPLAAALQAASAAATPLTLADEAARWQAEITEKFRGHR